jgi:hypothetical protein
MQQVITWLKQSLPRMGLAGLSTVEFLLNVLTGLLVGYILTLCVSGGACGLLTKINGWETICKSPEMIDLVRNGRVIALWQPFTSWDKAFFVALAANLIRLVHSFFLLQQNGCYRDLELGWASRIFPPLAKLLVTAGTFYVTVIYGSAWSFILGFAVMLALILWDWPVYADLKKRDDPNTRDLAATFRNWFTLEVFALGISVLALLGWVIYGWSKGQTIGFQTGRETMQHLSTIGLSVILAADYLVLNPSFYWDIHQARTAQPQAGGQPR